MKYDEQILLKGAARLEARASWIIFWTTIKHIVLAFLTFGLAAVLNPTTFLRELPAPTIATIGAVLGAIIGVFVGLDRAFELRLQAQQLIALVQIEHNTKSSLPH